MHTIIVSSTSTCPETNTSHMPSHLVTYMIAVLPSGQSRGCSQHLHIWMGRPVMCTPMLANRRASRKTSFRELAAKQIVCNHQCQSFYILHVASINSNLYFQCQPEKYIITPLVKTFYASCLLASLAIVFVILSLPWSMVNVVQPSILSYGTHEFDVHTFFWC